LCLWQLGEADGALAGSNVFALLHRLSLEPDHLLRRSIITAVGALSHPGKFHSHQQNMLCIACCFICLHLPVLFVLPRQKHKDLFAVRSQSVCTTLSTRERIMDFCWTCHQLC
jgi:hypothetical protein